MSENRRFWPKVPSLAELAAVLVIIGTLVFMATPRYIRLVIRSKQAEAKMLLEQIYLMELTYHHEYNTYWGNGIDASATSPSTFGRLGVDIMPSALYSYSIVQNESTFSVTATSSSLDKDAVIDTWTINQDGYLTCTSDDALN